MKTRIFAEVRKIRVDVREIEQGETCGAMNDEEIKQLLHLRADSRSRRRFRCPDETTLAAYFDQQLGTKARQALESHAAGCDSCLETLAFLTQSVDWTDSNEMPGYLVARARALVTAKASPVWSWRWPVTTAATACILLAVVFIYLNSRVQQQIGPLDTPLIAQNNPSANPVITPDFTTPQPAPSRPITKPNLNRGETPSVRGSEKSELTPVLVFPREGSVLRRGDLKFNWRPIVDATYYKVRLVSADGSSKLEKDTTELTLPVDDQLELQDGASYYVTVFAYRSDGSFTRSDIRRFRLIKD